MDEPQQFLIYQSEDGSTRINVMLEAETLWLSQKQLTELFGKAKGTISEHIKHIFEEGELDENSVVRFFRTTAADGKQYEVAYYNLDMVLCYVDRLLGSVVTDVDGNTEDRSDTASVFNGPPLVICTLKDEGEEIKTIGKWIAERA